MSSHQLKTLVRLLASGDSSSTRGSIRMMIELVDGSIWLLWPLYSCSLSLSELDSTVTLSLFTEKVISSSLSSVFFVRHQIIFVSLISFRQSSLSWSCLELSPSGPEWFSKVNANISTLLLCSLLYNLCIPGTSAVHSWDIITRYSAYISQENLKCTTC